MATEAFRGQGSRQEEHSKPNLHAAEATTLIKSAVMTEGRSDSQLLRLVSTSVGDRRAHARAKDARSARTRWNVSVTPTSCSALRPGRRVASARAAAIELRRD